MPGPIIDTGFDQAWARGVALGQRTRDLDQDALYQQGRLAHQAQADELARQRLENSLYSTNEHLDLANQRAVLAENKFQQTIDDQGRQRQAQHDYGAQLYDLEHGGMPEPEMGPFAEDDAPATQLYRHDRDQFGTMAEDLPAQALMEQAKAARAAARIRQLDSKIQAFENIDPHNFPGGPESYERAHTSLWMEREGLKGSVTSIMGPARRPAADPAMIGAEFDARVQSFGGPEKFTQGSLDVIRSSMLAGKHVSYPMWKGAMVNPAAIEAGQADSLRTHLNFIQRRIGSLANAKQNLPFDMSFTTDAEREARGKEIDAELIALTAEAGQIEPQLRVSQEKVGVLKGGNPARAAPAAATPPPQAVPSAPAVPDVDPLPGESMEQYEQRVRALMQGGR